MMRTFNVYERDGSQTKSVAHLTSPAQAKLKMCSLPDGDYTVRDCLGGLRMIVRVTDGTPDVIETTP